MTFIGSGHPHGKGLLVLLIRFMDKILKLCGKYTISKFHPMGCSQRGFINPLWCG